MRTIHTDVFQYDELDAHAQAKARDWLREATAADGFFAEHVTDTFSDLLTALGFELDTAPGRKAPAIYWSGFSSQGDGAAFSARWSAELCTPSEWLDERPIKWPAESGGHECPANKAWHDAAAPIIELAKEFKSATARVDNRGRGFHMALGDSYDFLVLDPDTDWDTDAWAAHDAANDAAGERFIEAARDLANTFYRALESEYDYQNSDESIAESLRCNEYEFTKEGNRA